MYSVRELLKYPNPTKARDNFVDLTEGGWEISFNGRDYYDINLPYPPESHLSGIGEPPTWDKFYYRKKFRMPSRARSTSKNIRVFLHFSAVDHFAKVYINKKLTGSHYGGHTPFSFDITDFLKEGENELFIEVMDYDHLDILRGKQSWKGRNFECWYSRTSGINGPVWLEFVETPYVKDFTITPLNGKIVFSMKAEDPDLEAELEIESVGKFRVKPGVPALIDASGMEKWSPEKPSLYPFVLKYGKDTVYGYLFHRTVGVKGLFESARITLNGDVFIFKGALDQRLYPKGLNVPEKPYIEAFEEDLNLAKAFGLNALRVHARVENPKFYTFADMMGIVIWQDFPPGYRPTDRLWKAIFKEGGEIIRALYNHPSVIIWTIFNESWGLDEMESNRFTLPEDPINIEHLIEAYRHFKDLDPTRLIVDNSGWEHVESDIFDWHSYIQNPEELKKHGEKILDLSRTGKKASYHPKEEKPLMWAWGRWQGEPFILSEFGGIGYAPEDPAGLWAYSEVKDEETYLKKLKELFESIRKISPAGFVYTQLYDVFQEKNGFAYASRKPKLSPEKISKIIYGF